MSEFGRYWRNDVPWGMVTSVLPTGVLALGISQLIWFLLETEQRPGWLLRNGHRLLYAYTAPLVVCYVWAGAADVRAHFSQPYDFPWRMPLLLLFLAVKVLALVGAAEILRRMLPVLEEHKSLV